MPIFTSTPALAATGISTAVSRGRSPSPIASRMSGTWKSAWPSSWNDNIAAGSIAKHGVKQEEVDSKGGGRIK